MAQLIQDSPQTKQPPKTSSSSSSSSGRSCFLGCFGFSRNTQKVKEKNKTTKFSSCFYWPRKSIKKSVPVGGDDDEDARTEKFHQKRRESFLMPKFSRKFSANKLPAAMKTQTPVDGTVEQSQIPAAVTGGGGSDESVHGRADTNKKGDEDKQKINLEMGKSMMNHHRSDSITKEPAATYKKSVFFRRNSWSQPATSSSSSSEHKNKTSQKPEVLSHSASMPPALAGHIYPARKNGGDDGCDDGDTGESSQGQKDRRRRRRRSKGDKVDQLVGMSIIMVTLIIMIIWGKLCAILCTSAWLYFYPILRSTTKVVDDDHHQQPMMITRNGSKSMDLNHTESKKSKNKVVFEGFLDRRHRA